MHFILNLLQVRIVRVNVCMYEIEHRNILYTDKKLITMVEERDINARTYTQRERESKMQDNKQRGRGREGR